MDRPLVDAWRLPSSAGFVIVVTDSKGPRRMTSPDQSSGGELPDAGPTAAQTGSGGMGILVFAFGLAAGILIAYSAVGFIEDSAGLILTIFLSALMVVLILGTVIFALRKTLLRRLFGHAEVALEQIADPLARVAERAIDRDPGGATSAARDLVAMVLSRYAWITTRRWIIASLTALIAAMAALAGTALLFKQNQLLAIQSDLLREQNNRIQEQTFLLQTDVQLAEAARNAALAVEITQIAADLGRAAVRAHGPDDANPFNVLDPATDLDRSLVLRVTSISRALLPYRFIDNGLHTEDATDGMRFALQRRRADLGDGYAKLAEYFGWQDRPDGTYLIDRPASPERGQLLTLLASSGVRNLEFLTYLGLDLDYAMLKSTDLALITAQQAQLSYADFSGSYLVECDFGSAILENARFRLTNIARTRFAALDPDQVRAPLPAQTGKTVTRLAGADFSRATIAASDFSGAELTAANFDGALLNDVKFVGANLSAATFRGAVLLSADFTGAILKRTDFDGAIVFGDDFLTHLTAIAAPDSFQPGRFRLDPIDPATLTDLMVVNASLTAADITAATNGAKAFRVTRIEPF
jgi:uncharacterized protein YjbI with pentapeptide repeats